MVFFLSVGEALNPTQAQSKPSAVPPQSAQVSFSALRVLYNVTCVSQNKNEIVILTTGNVLEAVSVNA